MQNNFKKYLISEITQQENQAFDSQVYKIFCKNKKLKS